MTEVRNITPVEPGTERWAELVQRALELDGQRNWFIGDAALEITPIGSVGTNTGAFGNLRKFAEEIGVEYNSVYSYRAVSAAWPEITRVISAPWSAYRALMAEGNQKLLLDGMTVAMAREAADQAAARAKQARQAAEESDEPTPAKPPGRPRAEVPPAPETPAPETPAAEATEGETPEGTAVVVPIQRRAADNQEPAEDSESLLVGDVRSAQAEIRRVGQVVTRSGEEIDEATRELLVTELDALIATAEMVKSVLKGEPFDGELDQAGES